MAPAVTSDTASCSRAPRLLTRDPTSLLSVALVNLGETALSMNSQAMHTSHDDSSATGDALGTVPFHPFARLPASQSVVPSGSQPVTDSHTKQQLQFVDGAGQTPPDMVNGVGVNPPQNLGSLSLSNACRISMKSVPQRTVSIVIKNNGACGAGIVSNSVRGPVLQTCVTSGNCNGGSCPETSVVVPPVDSARPDGSHGRFAAHLVPSLHQMLITPQMPNRDTASLSCDTSSTCCVTDGVDSVMKCDSVPAVDDVHSGVERTQAMQYESDTERAANAAVHVTNVAQPEEVALDTVLARQRNFVSRAGRTLMRLRRLQTREANSSVRRQVAGLVSSLRRSACQSATLNDVSAVRSTPDLKSMSTLELVGYVRQMQSSEALAQPPKSSALQLSVCPDMASTADRLSSNLRHLESAVDSDATESSSGGETDDEVEPFPAASDEYIVVSDANDRLKTKLAWSSERAMIASRWTWLQAQVSDLEYRIRQQSDLYRQLRSLKGAVTLYNSSSVAAESVHSFSDRSASDSSHKISSSSGVCEQTVDCNSVSPMTVESATCTAARCLPVRPCRRRRLLRPSGDTRLSAHRKSALLSTVRCTSCHPPATPCALCAGKYNSVVSLGTTLPSLERTALLDAAYHPVLSFSADVLTSLRLSECVQHTPLVTSSDPDSELISCMGKKGLTIKISKANLKCMPSRSFRRLVQGGSNKDWLANRPDGDYKESVAGELYNSEVAKTLHGRAALRDPFRRKRRFGLAGRHLGRSLPRSKPGRPARLTQSASSSSLRDALRRQNSRADFDINNVVIPYGATAAASLIDRHEYKEIITPKWREVKLLPLVDRRLSTSSPPAKLPKLDACQKPVYFTSGNESETTSADDAVVNRPESAKAWSQETDSEVEDLSDEIFATRHLRYEIYEKKQIQPLLGQRRRSRSNRSESEYSLTASANPRSPDPSGGVGLEAVGESIFVYPGSDEAPAHSDAAVYHLPEQTVLTPVDVRLCRISTATLATFTRTTSLGTETDQTDIRTTDVCNGSWPTRSFPLVDDDYDKLLATEASGCCPSTSVSAGLTVSVSSYVPPAGPDLTNNTDWTSGMPQSSGHSTPTVTPDTTLH